MTSPEVSAARRGRWAVAAMFFANGFVTGSWVPQVPMLLSRFDITETLVGLLILVFGLGALVAMPWCGWLMGRHGSRSVLRLFAALLVVALPPVALAPNIMLVVPAIFFLGAVIGGMDVAMNTNAVHVERQLGGAIMSSSHGFWSLGGFAGSASGGLIIQGAGHVTHSMLACVVALILVTAAWRWLVDGEKAAAAKKVPFSWPRDPLIYLIGIMALFCMIPEGSVLEWGALHLQRTLGAEIGVAGFAYGSFAITMAMMRFLGDGIRNRFGAVLTLRVSSLIAAFGIMMAGLASEAWIAIAAFALAGIGVANMVPIAFSAAGNHRGVASATAMSIVTTMGYSGMLVAPSAIGFAGERVGFSVVFVVLSLFLFAVCLMAGAAKSADFVSRTASTQ
jgi:MFS family permease